MRFEKKAQTWSFDLIIAVVLFIVIVGLFYSFLSSDTYTDRTTQLETGAQVIITQLNCDRGGPESVCIINRGSVDEAALGKITSLSYEEMKSELGVSGEFCIYMRTPSGALVPMNGTSGVGKNTTILFENSGTTIRCGEVLP